MYPVPALDQVGDDFFAAAGVSCPLPVDSIKNIGHEGFPTLVGPAIMRQPSNYTKDSPTLAHQWQATSYKLVAPNFEASWGSDSEQSAQVAMASAPGSSFAYKYLPLLLRSSSSRLGAKIFRGGLSAR